MPRSKAYGAGVADPLGPEAVRVASRARHYRDSARCVALLALLTCLPALGQETPDLDASSLAVTRGPGTETCPDAVSLRKLISEHLGQDPFVSTGPLDGRRIAVAFSRTGGQRVAALVWVDPDRKVSAERRLASDEFSCEGLTQAVVLAICLAVESWSPPPDAHGTRVVIRPRPVDTVEPTASPLSLIFGIGASAVFETLPRPTLETSALVGFRWKRLSIEIGAALDFPVTTDFQGSPIRTSQFFFDVAPCLHAGWFGACGVVGGGVLQASGETLSSPTSGDTPYAFAGLRLLAEIPLSEWLQLRPSIDLRAALTRTTLSAGGQQVWTTPPLSAAVGVALVVWPDGLAR